LACLPCKDKIVPYMIPVGHPLLFSATLHNCHRCTDFGMKFSGMLHKSSIHLLWFYYCSDIIPSSSLTSSAHLQPSIVRSSHCILLTFLCYCQDMQF
jgi:hypothetical protein